MVVALKHKIVEDIGLRAVNVSYCDISSTVKSASLLTPEQSEPVDKEYVNGWKHSTPEFVESSMNHESIGMITGSPCYSTYEIEFAGNAAGVRTSFPQTVTSSLNNKGLLATYPVEALMHTVSKNPYEVS